MVEEKQPPATAPVEERHPPMIEEEHPVMVEEEDSVAVEEEHPDVADVVLAEEEHPAEEPPTPTINHSEPSIPDNRSTPSFISRRPRKSRSQNLRLAINRWIWRTTEDQAGRDVAGRSLERASHQWTRERNRL